MQHRQSKLIVKNELVEVYVPSALTTNTRHVAQQPSNFSNLKIVDVAVSNGFLLIGIANGVEPSLQVYRVIGLVL